MNNTMLTAGVHLDLAARTLAKWLTSAVKGDTDEHGEGVISLAIAVLIMAVIGAAMYLVFRGVADDAGTTVKDKVATIK